MRRTALRKEPRAYYSENDPKAAAVLTQLIRDRVIAHGDVDTRSIVEVAAGDLKGYTQCHFFAGGGLWSVAARQAGWPDWRPLWTGSCPCQPYSVAGRRRGAADPRHLWPHFHRLIRACRPPVVVGEQVAGKAGYGWLDGIRADLAREDYAGRGVDIPACAVNAPHQRSRLYWIAVAQPNVARRQRANDRRRQSPPSALQRPFDQSRRSNGRRSQVRVLANAEGRVGWRDIARRVAPGRAADRRFDATGGLDHTGRARRQGLGGYGNAAAGRPIANRPASAPDGCEPWDDAGWIECHDGKKRRAQPAISMLVDGLPGRMGIWSIAGNAILPRLASEVIAAFLESEDAA